MKIRNNVVKMGVVASAAALALCGAVGPANAGIITGVNNPGVGGGIGAGTSATNAAGNDNSTTASANTVNIITSLTSGSTPFDITFNVFNAGGTSEFFVTNTITNNSGGNINPLTFLLGTGTGASFTPFYTGATDFDAPGFDPAPANPTGDFATTIPSAYKISYTNGNLAPGATGTFTFSFDIPDYGALGTTTTNAFTLRAVPNPEPGTWAMMAIGLIGLAAAAWRKKKQDGSLVAETPNLV